ncbi:MAG TPA: twin-arginine translocase TatA/TatE family subunit [Sphingobium sp.]|uniref:twin-arginine translocase TatA/TatE family subunit n=1 Tax=Sphingobium sp. TaxID=1912891 RepID=UPI002ED52867
MGFGSPIHWIVLMLVVVLLFGSGRISSVMGDVAKGIKSFKKGMADDDDETPPVRKAPPVQIEAQQVEPRSEQVPQPTASEHKQG